MVPESDHRVYLPVATRLPAPHLEVLRCCETVWVTSSILTLPPKRARKLAFNARHPLAAGPLCVPHATSPQRQPLAHQVHRAFGIGAMLAGSGAAARMMRNFHQRKCRQSEELRFSLGQLHENRLTQSDCRLALLLQLNRVVDTPRCARPSSSETGDDRVTPADKFRYDRPRRSLHMRRLGLEKHFRCPIFFSNQFC